VRRVILLSLAVLLAGCGGDGREAKLPSRPAGAHIQLTDGIAVDVPAGWRLATKLTPLAQPFERFTLSSGPLPSGPADNCGPREAVARLGEDDVLAFVIEYAKLPARRRVGPDFPPRSRWLTLPAGSPASLECEGRGRILRFRANGRGFQVTIAVGARATPRRVARLLAALERMRVDAREA
jgi:hypothetical protein